MIAYTIEMLEKDSLSLLFFESGFEAGDGQWWAQWSFFFPTWILIQS